MWEEGVYPIAFATGKHEGRRSTVPVQTLAKRCARAQLRYRKACDLRRVEYCILGWAARGAHEEVDRRAAASRRSNQVNLWLSVRNSQRVLGCAACGRAVP